MKNGTIVLWLEVYGVQTELKADANTDGLRSYTCF